MWDESTEDKNAPQIDPIDFPEIEGDVLDEVPTDSGEREGAVVRVDSGGDGQGICDHAEHKETFPAQKWAEANAMGVGAGVGDYDVVTVCHRCDGIWMRKISQESTNESTGLF
jgi:hypothetical protein